METAVWGMLGISQKVGPRPWSILSNERRVELKLRKGFWNFAYRIQESVSRASRHNYPCKSLSKS